MADSGDSPPPNRPSRGSGSLTVHLADELDVYFNEVAHGRPVGFVASPKWKPRTDVYETDEELIFHMDIAGMRAEDFIVELDESILKISGERATRQQGSGKRHYHAMEVQIGPFERRFRLPVVVDPGSTRAIYQHGFLEIRLAKQPPSTTGVQTVKVT
jgi:HSP20 family protein